MTEAALSHKLAGWKVRLIGARMPQMNGRFDDVFGRFFYKNQCSTIITTGEPSSLIWAAVFYRAGCLSLSVGTVMRHAQPAIFGNANGYEYP